MNKGRQATLFQSWGQKKKDTSDKITDLCDGLDEDDDEMLAEVSCYFLALNNFVLWQGIRWGWMSDCLMTSDQLFSYIMIRTSNIQYNENDVHFVWLTHVFYLYSASTLNQQSAGIRVTPLTHYSDVEPTDLYS